MGGDEYRPEHFIRAPIPDITDNTDDPITTDTAPTVEAITSAADAELIRRRSGINHTG